MLSAGGGGSTAGPPPRRSLLLRRRAALLTSVLAAVLPLSSSARAPFTDSQDGAFDTSEWMIDQKGFLPLPVIVTEPAVGYGAGLGLLFVRGSIRERAERSKQTGHLTPPDVLAVAAA